MAIKFFDDFYIVLIIALLFFLPTTSMASEILPNSKQILIEKNSEEGSLVWDIESEKMIPWTWTSASSLDEVISRSFFMGTSLVSSDGKKYLYPYPIHQKNTQTFSAVPGSTTVSKDLRYFTFVNSQSSSAPTIERALLKDGSQLMTVGKGFYPVETPHGIVFRDGNYQSGQSVYLYDTATQKSKALYTANGSFLTLLKVSEDENKVAVVERDAQNKISVRVIDIVSGQSELVLAETVLYSALQLKWSPQGDALALMAKHDTQSFSPYNLFVIPLVSQKISPLLSVKTLPRPGFFFGKGYEGVRSFDWTPDGESLIFLGAFEGDCRLSSAGGPVVCNNHLYSVHKDGSAQRKLAKESMTTGMVNRIRWKSHP